MADFNTTQCIANLLTVMPVAWPQINISANPFRNLFRGGFSNGTYYQVCAHQPKRGQTIFQADINTTAGRFSDVGRRFADFDGILFR